MTDKSKGPKRSLRILRISYLGGVHPYVQKKKKKKKTDGMLIIRPDSLITSSCAGPLLPVTLIGPNQSFDKLYPTTANHCETNRTNAIQ